MGYVSARAVIRTRPEYLAKSPDGLAATGAEIFFPCSPVFGGVAERDGLYVVGLTGRVRLDDALFGTKSASQVSYYLTMQAPVPPGWDAQHTADRPWEFHALTVQDFEGRGWVVLPQQDGYTVVVATKAKDAYLAVSEDLRAAKMSPGSTLETATRFVLRAAGPASRLPVTPAFPRYVLDNFALNKRATQSSTDPSYGATAQIPVNGVVSVRWWTGGPCNSLNHTQDGNNTPSPWWEVDLGRELPLAVVTVLNRQDCCKERLSNWDLQGSPDPDFSQGGRIAWSKPQRDTHRATFTIPFLNGETARCVRIQSHLSSAIHTPQVLVSAFRRAVNHALYKPATMSSEALDAPAYIATNGENEPLWRHGSPDLALFHTNNGAEQWWEVNLLAPVQVSLVRIHNRQLECYERFLDFSVFAGPESGKGWTFKKRYSRSDLPAGFVGVFEVPVDMPSIRFVRIEAHNSSNSEPIHFTQVEVIENLTDAVPEITAGCPRATARGGAVVAAPPSPLQNSLTLQISGNAGPLTWLAIAGVVVGSDAITLRFGDAHSVPLDAKVPLRTQVFIGVQLLAAEIRVWVNGEIASVIALDATTLEGVRAAREVTMFSYQDAPVIEVSGFSAVTADELPTTFEVDLGSPRLVTDIELLAHAPPGAKISVNGGAVTFTTPPDCLTVITLPRPLFTRHIKVESSWPSSTYSLHPPVLLVASLRAFSTTSTLTFTSKEEIEKSADLLDNAAGVDMSNCALTDLPVALKLAAATSILSILDLSRNSLHEFPDVRAMRNLHSLNLAYNRIRVLPATPLPLTALDISHNALTQLPVLSSVMEHLEVLDLAGNPLGNEALAAAKINLLAGLRELSISGPPLIPEEESAAIPTILQTLQSLAAYSAILDNIPAMLEKIDVDGNGSLDRAEVEALNAVLLQKVARLSGPLPPWVYQLQGLTRLEASSTLLSEVDDALALCGKLAVVDFSHCRSLTAVPGALGKLASLKTVRLQGCPTLKTPPKEIVRRGEASVLAFLRSLALGSVKCHRTKLGVVGIGAAGKTSLIRALRSVEFDEGSASTDGITILDWSRPIPGLSPPSQLSFTVLDYAGQAVYLNTHSLFLNERTVYVLAWNIRLGWEAGGIETWLTSIASRAPQAPVLIVGTHADQVPMGPIPTSDIKKRFPQVRGFYSVSSKTGLGIAGLEAVLVEAALSEPYMGEAIPASWLKLEDLIVRTRQEQGVSVITFDEYKLLALQCAIEDSAEVLRATAFLDALSVVKHYKDVDALANLVILDASWLMDVLARLVTAQKREDVPGLEVGTFSHDDIGKIWAGYDPALFKSLLLLTEQFDLTFPLPDAKHSLVPCLLPEDAPEGVWPELLDPSECETFREYQFPFLPHGLFSRAVVRLNPYEASASTLWKTGVLLRMSGHYTLVQALPKERKIRVDVRGPSPLNSLLIVHSVLDTLLLESYAGLREQMDVILPCDDCIERRGRTPSTFLVKDIRRASSQGVPVLQCARFFHMCPVEGLLAKVPRSTAQELSSQVQEGLDSAEGLARSLQRQVFICYTADNSMEAFERGEVPSSDGCVVDPRRVAADLADVHGFDVYLDSREDEGQALGFSDTALMIANAKVVLAFVSDEFAADARATRQLTYATSIARSGALTIIPVVVGRPGESKWAQSSAGLIIAGALWVDFRSKADYANSMRMLTERVSMALGGPSSSLASGVAAKPYDVFISYCWANSKAAFGEDKAVGVWDPREVARRLDQEAGVPCWLDVERLGGAGLFEDICKGLRGAKLVVLFVSDQYAKSENCKMECRFTLKSIKVPAIVCYVGSGLNFLTTEVGLLVTTVKDHISMLSADDQNFKDLVAKIKSILGEPSAGGAAASLSSMPSSGRKKVGSSRAALRHQLSQALELAQRSHLQRTATADEAAGREQTLAPRLFAAGWVEAEARFTLTLLCERPGGWHVPQSGGKPYAVEGNAETFLWRTAVYAERVTKLLSAVPGSLLELLSRTLTAKVAEAAESVTLTAAAKGMDQEAAFREAYACYLTWLLEADRSATEDDHPKLGGLQRCRIVTGETLFLCPHCAAELRGTPVVIKGTSKEGSLSAPKAQIAMEAFAKWDKKAKEPKEEKKVVAVVEDKKEVVAEKSNKEKEKVEEKKAEPVPEKPSHPAVERVVADEPKATRKNSKSCEIA